MATIQQLQEKKKNLLAAPFPEAFEAEIQNIDSKIKELKQEQDNTTAPGVKLGDPTKDGASPQPMKVTGTNPQYAKATGAEQAAANGSAGNMILSVLKDYWPVAAVLAVGYYLLNM